MVYGNISEDSGTGVAMSRNASNGRNELEGDFLMNAQGEDVVAGIRMTEPISELKAKLPEVYDQFREIARKLEQHYRNMQDMEFIAGLNVMEANRPISQKLKEKGLMFRKETVEHSYPFCWRTDTPLIYKPISTWFVKVESFRDRMVEHNRKVHWVPGHIRDGRFGKWLENARDWAISRNRFWGTPLPIWKSEDGDTNSRTHPGPRSLIFTNSMLTSW